MQPEVQRYPMIVARRTLLKWLPLPLLFMPLMSCGVPDNLKEKTIALRLTHRLRYKDNASKLGELFVLGHNKEKQLTMQALNQLVINKIGLKKAQLSVLSQNQIDALLSSRIRQDFTDEEVEIIDGWLLANTEAWLCGLLYKHKQRSMNKGNEQG